MREMRKKRIRQIICRLAAAAVLLFAAWACTGFSPITEEGALRLCERRMMRPPSRVLLTYRSTDNYLPEGIAVGDNGQQYVVMHRILESSLLPSYSMYVMEKSELAVVKPALTNRICAVTREKCSYMRAVITFAGDLKSGGRSFKYAVAPVSSGNGAYIFTAGSKLDLVMTEGAVSGYIRGSLDHIGAVFFLYDGEAVKDVYVADIGSKPALGGAVKLKPEALPSIKADAPDADVSFADGGVTVSFPGGPSVSIDPSNPENQRVLTEKDNVVKLT
jgi:hypothetical protein